MQILVQILRAALSMKRRLLKLKNINLYVTSLGYPALPRMIQNRS